MEHKKIEIFGNTHSLSILMYLTDHSGCTKTDLYQEVVRNSRMPDKLNVLEKAGLIHQVQDGRASRLPSTCSRSRTSCTNPDARALPGIETCYLHGPRIPGSLWMENAGYAPRFRNHLDSMYLIAALTRP